ncbi:MAG: hypothetical protein HY368_00545 [Candidatus Aenigmarchaeota archaeon]|nr:hypothetical protein [Candidatus Aenigmarchaeota archaeon]
MGVIDSTNRRERTSLESWIEVVLSEGDKTIDAIYAAPQLRGYSREDIDAALKGLTKGRKVRRTDAYHLME